MNKISKYFNIICTQKYKSLGFYRNKTTFVRMREDVIQTFSLKVFHRAPVCTVEFGVVPLCSPQPFYLDAGVYELNHFFADADPQKYGSVWKFDAGSEESMVNCAKSISNAIDLHLLPLFERCYDCQSALHELIKLEELFNNNRKKYLQSIGTSDLAISWQERSLFDHRKYYMALKIRDFTYAYRYLSHQVNCYKNSLESFEKPNSPKQPAIVIDRHLSALAEYTALLKRLDSGNFSYFDNLVKSNEHQMKVLLATNYPKLAQGEPMGQGDE